VIATKQDFALPEPSIKSTFLEPLPSSLNMNGMRKNLGRARGRAETFELLKLK